MIAPSEKHLQDYLWDHPDVFDYLTPDLYEYQLFKREAVLPSGRADFLARRYGLDFYVVETKKDAIKASSIAQILRYIGDIERIWTVAISGLPDPDPPRQSYARIPKVSGLLIGSSIEPDLLVASVSAGIYVMLYDFDGQDYTLTEQHTTINREHDLDYAYGYIGEVCREIYMSDLFSEYGDEVDRMPNGGLNLEQYRRSLDLDLGEV